MWADIIRDLLAGMEGEWPADENTGARYPCCLCEHPPGTQAICTDSGPAHTHHDTVDLLGAAVVIGEWHTGTEVIRLRGWEVAQIRTHPSGQMHVAVLGVGEQATTQRTWLDDALTLWGFTPTTLAGWDAEVEALADRFDRQAS